MSIGIIITGIMGRMGKEIANVVFADPQTTLVGCTEAPGHKLLGHTVSSLFDAGSCDISISASVDNLPVEQAVVIDFTAPAATCNLVQKLRGRNAKIVIGTTGLSCEQTELIHASAQYAAILMSPNMSLGVNLLFYLTQEVAKRLDKNFNIEIIEAHHRMKKDSPSGTARRLGEIAAEARGLSYQSAVRNGREGIVGERTDTEIGMHAVRGGDIVGDHTVLFAGPGERLELRHMAHSRSILASGAVAAAKWLSQKPNGLYSMGDVLGF